ncbi:MAG: MFS transporter, partial [Actinomycetota bacterium]|nr:MFS transporter [Actinomycetota bacterium]
HGWSLVAADLCAALAGVAIPQVGSMIRARWAHLLDDDGLHTAFAVESIADEVVYVVGPALVTVLSTMFLAQTGLLVALVVGTFGPLVLAAQRGTEPPAHPRQPLAETARLPWRALVPLTLSTASLGALFGAMDVATVAFCTDVGHRGASGWILAVLSFGSLLAGLVTGARTWRTPVLRRFQVGMATLSVSFVLLTQTHSLWVLGPLMFLAGFAIAPTLIAGFSLLEAVTPRARLTEALGFLQTGISAGIAPGAYLAGVVADHAGGATAYWVCVASGTLATAAAFATRDQR